MPPVTRIYWSTGPNWPFKAVCNASPDENWKQLPQLMVNPVNAGEPHPSRNNTNEKFSDDQDATYPVHPMSARFTTSYGLQFLILSASRGPSYPASASLATCGGICSKTWES